MTVSRLHWCLTGLFVLSACSPPTPPVGNDAAQDATNTSDIATNDTLEAAVADAEDVVSADTPDVRTGPATWHRDIRPLTEKHCVTCHTAGGIAPMPLTTFAEAQPFAGLMAYKTTNKQMPPFPPDMTNCRELDNPKVLSAAEIALFDEWSRTGAQEGNPADYVPPVITGPARPLPPTGDVAVQPDQAYTPNPARTDDYHCFVIDPNLTQDRDMIGIRVTPGNGRIVHHVLLYEVRTAALPQLQALDNAEAGPGYTCFGGPGVDANFRQAPAGSTDLVDFDQQLVGGWAPGNLPTYFPTNTGLRLKSGSKFVMQVHYNQNASTLNMSDRSRVDLYFAPIRARYQGFWLPLAQTNFLVPAGTPPTDPRATVTATQDAIAALKVYGVTPHMHTRGSSIRVDVQRNGTPDMCLINIPQWNFHWQQTYWFKDPFSLQSLPTTRDRVRLRCVYDNTPANQPIVNGVQTPPHDLSWGEGTDDEMCLNYGYVSL